MMTKDAENHGATYQNRPPMSGDGRAAGGTIQIPQGGAIAGGDRDSAQLILVEQNAEGFGQKVDPKRLNLRTLKRYGRTRRTILTRL